MPDHQPNAEYGTPFEMPEGKRWCPECNGEGQVWTMEATPDMNEHVYGCTFPGCDEGQGIVPIEGSHNESEAAQ